VKRRNFHHSLGFFALFFGVADLSFVSGFFFTEPLGRPRGRFGPVGLGAASFFFVDFEPLGRPLPLLTTGSPDCSLTAAGAGDLAVRPRFFAELAAASTSGILITGLLLYALYQKILKRLDKF